ncbi:MAG: hypothetical protein JWN17_296 [Frankiales bacterium]|nr:hypothetical protein [Frankiales bacterium]
MLVDGVGSRALADSLVDGLLAAGRPPVRVSAGDFLRPAGERLEHGREDAQDFRERWLDAGALRREVLEADGTWLPALWDAARDRSARAAVRPLPERAVVVVDGLFLLDHAFPADLVVHVALSAAALRRRGVPEWQLEAFRDYDDEVRPGEACDVLVRAEDPQRPAVLFRR